MYEVKHYEQTNVVGTEVVAREARDRGIPLINMSSRAVYGVGAWSCSIHGEGYETCCGHSLPRPSREGDRLNPCSVYGETKVRAEAEVVRLACRDWPALSLRPQNVVGAGQATHNPYTGVLAAFSAKLRAGLPPVVYGDGTQTRDFVHVDDVVNTLTWLAQHVERWPPAGALNVGTGQRTTIRQLAEIALALRPIGDTQIEHVDVVRAGDIEHGCADLTLSRTISAPQAAQGTEQAVADFLDWAETQAAVPADTWDAALDELRERGLLS
jgi:dTDP-L-rhamnose 4-epimerase